LDHRRSPSFDKVLACLLLIAAGLSLFFVLFVIVSRINYPYSVERMEGASLLQVMRISTGQPLYAQPTIDYIPLIYPPVYFYLSALATKILGLGFAPLRLVSSLAFVGSLVLIYLIIRSITQNTFSSLVGAGFFAATYPLSGIWFDVARVDTLFVFFCIAAIWFSSRNDAKDLFLSSIFWVLTVFTKQTGSIALICCFAYLLYTDFRKNSLRLLYTALGGIIAYLVCSFQWGEWFPYFIFHLPTFHQSQDNLTDILFSLNQLLLPLLLALLVSIIPFLVDKKLWSKQQPVLYYAFMTCVLFGLSFLGRLNLGGFTNVYMPAHAMISIMLGAGLNWWIHTFQKYPSQRASLLKSVLYLLCIVQFLSISYDPRWVIPTGANVKSWSRIESLLASTEGNVLVPELNYLAAFAEKPAFMNEVALEEILGEYGRPEPVQSSFLQQEVNRALQEQQFELIFLKQLDGIWQHIADHYDCIPVSERADTSGLPHSVVEEYYACSPK
jgi:4-amino-4-deoxy-L-arabinose transferase-like glycosyltransferase